MQPTAQRRSSSSHAAILEAAWDLAQEVGHARLTVEAIARRAGVGKQTIYRWWPTKEAVLLEVLDSRTGTTLDFPDTGDVRRDLTHQVAEVTKILASEEYAPYRGLIGAAQSDPELARQIRETIIEPRVAACVERVVKAQKDGQLRDDVDPRDVVDMLYGPVYYRLLLQTRPLRPADTRRQVSLALEGLTDSD